MPRGGSLIFDWPGRHTLHPVLPACIILAVVFHAGLFYAFTIVYPAAEPAGPRPVQAFFVPDRSSDHARLEAILQTDDPAIFAPGRGLFPNEKLPASRYTPVYKMDKTVLDPLPAAAVAKIDSLPPTGPVRLPAQRITPVSLRRQSKYR